MKKFILFLVALATAFSLYSQSIADFENLSLATDTFWNGSDLSGGFGSGAAFFNNVYDTAYGGYWAGGFAYSNMYGNAQAAADTPFTNSLEYSAVTGKGYGNIGNYAVGTDDGAGGARVKLVGNAAGGIALGFYATNSLYAYLSMLHGDQFEPAFSYANSDWFELNITGWRAGAPVNDTVHFYLADFRTPYSPGIDTDWEWVSLLPLGDVDSVVFSLASSQTGMYGINTPAYFCIDNFTTADAPFAANSVNININYLQDTAVDVLPDLVAGNSPSPLTLSIVSGPLIPGASAILLGGDTIWYVPTDGVVATDTVTYQLCDTTGYCSTGQIYFNISDLTGIGEVAQAPQSKAFPNPFNSSFKISYTGNLEVIKLYDLQGRLIKTVPGNQMANQVEIDGNSLAAGPYLVRVITDAGTSIAKIVKQ